MAVKVQQIGAMTARHWMMLSILALMWGSSFVFVELVVDALPTFALVALRLTMAAGALYAYMRFTGVAWPGLGQPAAEQLKMWRSLLVLALANNTLPIALFMWGQTYITASLMSVLITMTPVFAVTLANFAFQDERLTASRLFGLAISVVGVATIIGVNSLNVGGGQLWGQLAGLGAAFSYAVGGVLSRKMTVNSIKPVQIALGQSVITASIMWPLTLIFENPFAAGLPGLQVWLALVGMAIFATAAAYVIFFNLIGQVGVSNASLVALLIPVATLVLGIGLLGERLSEQQVMGIAVMAFGLMFVDGRLIKWLRRKTLLG